ncbi:MAG: hypothetical protein ACR2G6_06855 [Gemmatimonadaceae bacterium]
MATASAEDAISDPELALGWLAADPVRFSIGLLGDELWPTQRDILHSVATEPRTAVRACHASSKTFSASRAVLWWLVGGGVVVTTAPTWTQVERLLWGEIRKAAAQGAIAFPTVNKTEIPIAPDNYAIGLSTNEGVRFQGWHGRILIVLDEAPGVLPEIYEAIEGIRAGGDVHILLMGNPTIASGPFYEAFTTQRASWRTFTISAFDTPNLAGLTLEGLLAMDDAELSVNPKPYLVTRRWVAEKYREWGVDDPRWQSRVLGQFPEQSEDALISLAWLEAARRAIVPGDSDDWAAGLDVAGPGKSETVLWVRRGAQIKHFKAWTQPDPRGAVVAELAPWKRLLKRVNVDEIGIGYYFAQHLRDNGYPVVGITVGDPARDKERFANLKAELYWALRDRFKENAIGGLTDDATITQLAAIRFAYNPRGQVVIESKDALAARGVPSPDRAEGLMLAFAPAPPVHRRSVVPASTSYASV